MSEPGLNEEKKEKMAQAIQVLKEAFDIPNDESLKVSDNFSLLALALLHSFNWNATFSGPETP